MSALPMEAAMRREPTPAERIPYLAHVSPHIVKTRLAEYSHARRLGGASLECADDETLNTWHERVTVLWRNIASPQVAIWSHVIRRREAIASRDGGTGFSGAPQQCFRTRLAAGTLLVNHML